jgi:hypothetical protein
MFRTVPLSIIRSFPLYTQQWYISCKFADNLRAVLEGKSTYFGQFLYPLSGVFHCTHSNGICHTGLLTACEQDHDGNAVPSWSCSQAVIKSVWYIPLLCVQWKTSDNGQSNCPKYVEFPSKTVCKLSTDLYDINHCCVYSEKFLVMDRGTVRNM